MTEAASTDALAPAGYTAIGPFVSERALKEAALVLASVAIPHAVAPAAGFPGAGGVLLVRNADYDRARTNLDRYEEENRDFPPRRVVERPRYGGLPWMAIAFALLVAFAFVTGPVAKPSGPFFREGSSVAELVLSTEPFRAVTALTLHADTNHVLSNLLSGALFGRAVERRLGPGAAAAAIVASGTLGNVANAAFYSSLGEAHASIGASTAVFGAVGLLATTQLVLGGRHILMPTATGASRAHWTEYAAPLVGGFALLGTLGSSPSSDIFAHAFGLAAGIFVGIPFALIARRSRTTGRWAQLALGISALAAIGGSWALALHA
jgi:membrane associated rhomboid family serine protease